MASPLPPQIQLDNLINSMLASGILDQQFLELQRLQDQSTPNFLSDLITKYCNEGVITLNDLTKLLERPGLRFRDLTAPLHQIKGSSSSIGAVKVKDAIVEFRAFAEGEDIDGCRRTLQTARTAFYEVRENFFVMLNLMRRINGGSPQQ